MIKFALTIWVCSFLQGEVCMKPITSPTLYNSWYECSRAAHVKSLQIMVKLGYKNVNEKKIATKFICKPLKTI
jgi:hypothetical protein